MEMMSAARLHDVASPFTVDRVPVPTPGDDDVLVRVHACTIVPNLKNVAFHYPEWFPFLPLPSLPAIYGLDPAGEIVAVGRHVSGLEAGQRVYVNPARTCGACVKCRRGDTVSCESFTFAGYFGFGPGSRKIFDRYPSAGLGEFMVAPASSIVTIPDNVTYEQASRFGYLGTSYAALCHAKAGPRTSVLINGGTGTLGIGAAMLALAMGVPKILAVARNKDLLAELKALAPDRIETFSTLDGSCTDWAKRETDGFGPDIVIEALGPEAPPEVTLAAIHSISRGGTVVTIGGMDKEMSISPIWFMINQIAYQGSLWFSTSQGQDIAAMAQAGTLDLSRFEQNRFELKDVNEALEAARHREHGGFSNVVVML